MGLGDVPAFVEEWLEARPQLWGSAEWHSPTRISRLPFKVDVPGAMRFFQYIFVTAALEDDFYHVIDGELNFACDAANVLLVQCGLRYKGKSTSVDLRTFGDAGSIRMVRLLIRNMVGMGKTLDTPVVPPVSPPPFDTEDEDLSVDMDAGLVNGKETYGL